MNELAGLTFGQRVAYLRKKRGMSQRVLAATIDRSESWTSQVERDILPVERLSVLQRLADGLGVSMVEIEPSTAPPGQSQDDDRSPIEELDSLRAVLSGHPDLAAALGGPGTTTGPDADDTDAEVDADALDRAVTTAWEMSHNARPAALGRVLTETLPTLEAAVRRNHPDTARLHALRARAYQAAATAFAGNDEADAAWVAADRAVTAAEQAGDTLGIVAGLYRMARAFARVERFEQAERVARLTLDQLAPLVAEEGCPSDALSLAGSLHLVRATIAAGEGRRAPAHADIDAARSLATRVGDDHNDRETGFGPTNVEVHALGAAVDLGDAGEALDIAGQINVERLTSERRATFHIDLARAHAQRRRVDDATTSLVVAEELTPELFRANQLVRVTISLLLEIAGRGASDELRRLAHRSTAVPL